jgi:hypothetical protein
MPVADVLRGGDENGPPDSRHVVPPPVVAHVRMLADVVLVAVVLHRDLEVAVYEVRSGDEISLAVVDGVLTLRLGQSVRAQYPLEYELALALCWGICRIAFGKESTEEFRSLPAAPADST